MTGLGALAATAAPAAGGLLLGGLASNLKGPGLRDTIKADLEILEQLPGDDVARRAALQRVIDSQLDRLITGDERGRTVRRSTWYFTDRGNWRFLVLFLMSVLFAVICWTEARHRTYWLPLVIASILWAMVLGFIVVRDFIRSYRAVRQPPQRL